jgi:hypothetical protein
MNIKDIKTFAKVVLIVQFIALNVYVRTVERLNIDDLSLPLKKLCKEEHINPKYS